MSNTDTEQLQQSIERTRAELSHNVDRLTDKVSPPRVVGRQVDRVKSGASGLRDRVMGSPDDGAGLHGAGDSLGSAVGGAKQTLADAPQNARQQAQGNPLGAGLVAFGVGMVLSSLLPPTEAEQRLAGQAEQKAKEYAEPVKQAGQQLADDLKPAAQHAAEQVKSSAQDAVQQTTQEAKSATRDVKAPLQQG